MPTADPPPLVSRTFPVGRYRCTIRIPPPRPGQALAIAVAWAPTTPERLSEAEIREYYAGRDRALAELAGALGVNVAAIDA